MNTCFLKKRRPEIVFVVELVPILSPKRFDIGPKGSILSPKSVGKKQANIRQSRHEGSMVSQKGSILSQKGSILVARKVRLLAPWGAIVDARGRFESRVRV